MPAGSWVSWHPDAMRVIARMIWLAIRIGVAVAIVVVPFGYAITGLHTDVLMGVGCGMAIGLGVGLRGGPGSGPWTGILTGAIVGVATALIAGLIPGNAYGFLVPPVLALAVGLIAGFRGASITGYRDMSKEALIVSVLVALGFLPAWIEQGSFARGVFSYGALALLATLWSFSWTALVGGILSHRREGWRDTRPPLLLVLAASVIPIAVAWGMFTGALEEGRGLSGVYLALAIAAVGGMSIALTAVAFLVGRGVISWLEPRLRVYGYLADYLNVMWVPIGAFAVGYLTIIVIFAGFYGTLERFQPGAFAEASVGIAEWLSFSFFTALGQEFAAAEPVSAAARILVGIHLIISAGWAVVLFAAVMSSIGPKLDEIARRHAQDED